MLLNIQRDVILVTSLTPQDMVTVRSYGKNENACIFSASEKVYTLYYVETKTADNNI